MNNYGISNKKIMLILAGLVVVIIVLIVLYISRPSAYGVGIDIKGYSKYIKDLPQDSKDSLGSTLYNVVKMNLPDSTDINVKDATIRDAASTTKEYSAETKLTSGTFIVDIASLKQSYLMYYEWSTVSSAESSGYSVTARCLPKDKLKYGDFNCKDMFSTMEETTDPIMAYLPYETVNYKVTANYNSDKIALDVDIHLGSLELNEVNRKALIAQYSADFEYWMTWNDFNPADYTVNYTVN